MSIIYSTWIRGYQCMIRKRKGGWWWMNEHFVCVCVCCPMKVMLGAERSYRVCGMFGMWKRQLDYIVPKLPTLNHHNDKRAHTWQWSAVCTVLSLSFVCVCVFEWLPPTQPVQLFIVALIWEWFPMPPFLQDKHTHAQSISQSCTIFWWFLASFMGYYLLHHIDSWPMRYLQ